jgi:hypothetical protein
VTHRNLGVWCAYVEGGATKEERRERLSEVPEDMRKQVENHVRTVFSIRNYQARKKK